MPNTTYGFGSLYTTIMHPAIGQIVVQGSGVGSITFTMANDVSAHDVAADGSVMTSKIKSKNGTIAISVQQTSEVHEWLTRLHNYLIAAPDREWAQIELVANSVDMRTSHSASNISIQKRADKPYQAQGQQVTWTLMAGELTER